jgi:Predicted membrane protein
MMYCTNCGHKNPENSRFCEQCGTPLEGGQQTPPTGQGVRIIPSLAKTSMPIWVLVSVIAGGAVLLGFLLPWMSAGMFGYGVKVSGLTFIFYILRIMFSGILGWLDGGQVFLLVVAFLLIIALLILIVVMAVRIILAGVKLLGNQQVSPGEADAVAAKIKRNSIIGLILMGIYFLLVMVVVGGIMADGLLSMNTLAFGFWLCLIGFGAALLGATVVKQQNF